MRQNKISLEKHQPRHEGNPTSNKTGSKNSSSCSVACRNGLHGLATIFVILTRVGIAFAIAPCRLGQGPSRDVVVKSDQVRSETIAGTDLRLHAGATIERARHPTLAAFVAAKSTTRASLCRSSG